MESKSLLVENDHVVAIEQDLGGDSVIVTFNELGTVRNGLRFWGDEYLLKQGISSIGIVTPRPNWYPATAMQQIIAAVVAKIGGRKTITYGHSQGGYGALKFSASLNASVALSFCPQWSINPVEVASFDGRFLGYFDMDLENGLGIQKDDLCDKCFVFFDKRERSDAKNADKIVALGRVKSVAVPFSMHGAIRLIAEARSAAKIISLCVGTKPPDVTDFRRIVRASRRQSETYVSNKLFQLTLRACTSRSRSSAFLEETLAATKNDNPLYTSFIAFLKGDVNAARSSLTSATADHFNKFDLVALWQLMTKLRFLEAELALAKYICDSHPDKTFLGLHAVNTLLRAERLEEASCELSRLAAHADATIYMGHFAEFSLKLGRIDVIEALLGKDLVYSTRVSVLFRLVDYYQRLGDRRQALRKLGDLSIICANSKEELARVAVYKSKVEQPESVRDSESIV